MSNLIPLIMALAGALVTIGVLSWLWKPGVETYKKFQEAIKFHDPIGAAVIAFAGEVEAEDEAVDYTQGISSEVHEFLDLNKEQYARGVKNFTIFMAVCFLLVAFLFGAALISCIIIAAIAGVMTYFITTFTANDRIQSQMTEQVRQFPFFLDIFLLTVQSNGNIEDAIESYHSIFGHNEIAQELVILREDLKSHDLIDSFERLRNRVGNEGLRNILGELTQKLRTGTELQKTLEQQSEDMRTLREELGAQAAERLNAKFNIPVILSAVAVLLIFLSPAIVQMVDSGFL
ncbi:tight adherance operon protein [Amylibacter marinus]|uniref:Tight adherance operon protein n=1 Tax=Amylibacter marinus TaxID=1475483 RepID=A0ABQ5VXE1_9RHOB|nr:type II secretion system F family protein [Amylibacter marinus]GLQ35943.1 tight adherance operon protein [Amylibacter marinus]